MEKREFRGFRIFRQEPLSHTFKRLLPEQLNQSLALCDHYPENPDYVTHELRKSTKRIRAMYRLFGLALGKDAYLHGKEFYGTLGLSLAEHRVSHVYIETMQRLAFDKKLPAGLLIYLNRQIAEQESRHNQLTCKLLKEQKIDQQVKEIIVAERLRLIAEPIFSCDFTNVAGGLCRTYKLGRKDLDLVIQHAGTENLHNLRKRVKSQWNQLILLKPLWPAVIGLTIHQFDLLAEKLGTEHDLAELEYFLGKMNNGSGDNHHITLINFITKKRQQTQRALIPLAIRLFAEKPEALVTKMRAYYQLFKGK
jgi:CHAD domain-containing protein